MPPTGALADLTRIVAVELEAARSAEAAARRCYRGRGGSSGICHSWVFLIADLQSRDYLRSLIEGKDVMVATVCDKREKYGRYLGEIWLLSGESYTNINDALVTSGHAQYKSH